MSVFGAPQVHTALVHQGPHGQANVEVGCEQDVLAVGCPARSGDASWALGNGAGPVRVCWEGRASGSAAYRLL